MISESEKKLILATKSRIEFDKALKSIFGDKPVSLADVGDEVIEHMNRLNEHGLEDHEISSKKRVY